MQANNSLTCIAYCLLNPLLPLGAFAVTIAAHADIVCLLLTAFAFRIPRGATFACTTRDYCCSCCR